MQMGAIASRHGYETAAWKAIDAGVDVLLVCNALAWDPDVAPRTIELVSGWVRAGRLDEARMGASHERIQACKALLPAP